MDPTGFNEDIDHNELYFDQFLAWFGAGALVVAVVVIDGGRFVSGPLTEQSLLPTPHPKHTQRRSAGIWWTLESTFDFRGFDQPKQATD